MPLPITVTVGVTQTEVWAPETLEQEAVAPQTVAGAPEGAHWLPIEAVTVGCAVGPQVEVVAPETLAQVAVEPQTVAGVPDGAHWLAMEAVVVGATVGAQALVVPKTLLQY